MHCPNCHAQDTKVIDSRTSGEGMSIRRRRQCIQCESRFTTYEEFQIQLPMVVKADGRRESFSKDKIFRGLKKACQKRPVSMEDLERIVGAVEKSLIKEQVKEVRASLIGEILTKQLLKLDPVSYVRFASFYMDYDDIKSFVQHLESQEFKEHEQ